MPIQESVTDLIQLQAKCCYEKFECVDGLWEEFNEVRSLLNTSANLQVFVKQLIDYAVSNRVKGDHRAVQTVLDARANLLRRCLYLGGISLVSKQSKECYNQSYSATNLYYAYRALTFSLTCKHSLQLFIAEIVNCAEQGL